MRYFLMDPGHYYGGLASWDLLYMGHCGDYLNSIEDGVQNSEHSIAPVDVSGHGKVGRTNETPNIECGFDSKHFYIGDDVEKR